MAALDEKHGTKRPSASTYTYDRCRCTACRRAWADASIAGTDRYRARLLARGLTTGGAPRQRPYTLDNLAMLERNGLRPDPRFVRRPR